MTMSDENLVAFVAEVRTVTPSAGESLVTGSLRSQGYHVSRERVQEALRSSDPLGSALRWPGVSTVFTEGLSVACHVGLLLHVSVSESVCVGQGHAIFCYGECEKAAIHIYAWLC